MQNLKWSSQYLIATHYNFSKKKLPMLKKFIWLLYLLTLSHSFAKKNILIIYASDYEKKILEHPSIKKSYSIFYYHSAHKNISQILQDIQQHHKKNILDGVLSTQDYIGNICSTLIAKKFELPGPTIESVVTCQHKYYSRLAQKRFVPDATPSFGLIDLQNLHESIDKLPFTFPFFVKPVKSYFSFGAMKINSYEELEKNIFHLMPASTFLEPLNEVLKKYNFPLTANYLLAEEILKGKQITIEGFVKNGTVHIIGIVDSIMYPGTISFEHFEYPSLLPKNIQERMACIAKKIIKGIGFNNSFFNIEMMYDQASNKISIIEINPRAAAQFADLYEKVDGTNAYDIMLSLATNSPLPTITRKKGNHAIAASFALRVFKNGKVIQSPSEKELTKVQKIFPDARIQIHTEKGKKLSDELQDGKSYVYAIINLGGKNKNDLLSHLKRCKKMLPFRFSFFKN